MTDGPAQSAVAHPAPALRPFISHYAGFRAEGLRPETHAGLPSRHVHLIISFVEPIELLRAPDPSQRPGRFTALVGGLHDTPALVQQTDRVHLVHVFFSPLGVRAILGVPNSAIASRVIELSDLWGTRATQLVDRLANSANWNTRFAHLDEAFMRALRPHGVSAPAVWAWRELARHAGQIPMSSLAQHIGWSRAHFTDRFRTDFGLSPKTAARIFRFEHACRALKAQPRQLADVALSSGYYDQAHMTREWQALAGLSPRQWIARELPFLQDYELPLGDDDAHDAYRSNLLVVQRRL
jgi:AraC-like DNA-binding protein